MKIWEYVYKSGAGMTASAVLHRIPDPSAELWDVQEALRWAELDGKVTKIGAYYWRAENA